MVGALCICILCICIVRFTGWRVGENHNVVAFSNVSVVLGIE